MGEEVTDGQGADDAGAAAGVILEDVFDGAGGRGDRGHLHGRRSKRSIFRV